MLTYLRRIEKTPAQRRALISNPFAKASRYEKSDKLPTDFSERRLNRRIFNYWQDRCKFGAWPEPRTIRGSELGADWDKCFILDVRANFGFPKFEYLGPGLAGMSGVFLSGESEWTQTLLDKATEQVDIAMRTRKPVVCDDDLTLFDGSRVLFRSVLLPLGAEGCISHLLGAANGKHAEAAAKPAAASDGEAQAGAGDVPAPKLASVG